MRRMRLLTIGVALVSAAIARAQTPVPWVWPSIPSNFARPRVPADNPMTVEKVSLGRHLFYDTRLSGNGTQSCATCHEQARAFTDGRGQAIGSTGEVHPRGSMSLVNIAYAASLTWGNPTMTKLEEQALVPMFGADPIELGLERPGTALLSRLRDSDKYRTLFAAAFRATPDPVSLSHVTQALAAFERTLVSARSPYDTYHNERDDTAISAAARR